MKTIQIAREVLSNLKESFDEKTGDEIAKSFLKIVADKFGTEFISECITQYPNKGYFVRYLDDATPKLIAKQHSENLKKNNDLIKNILMKTKREILIEELAKGDGSIKIGHLKTVESVIYNAMDSWLAENNLNIPVKESDSPQCDNLSEVEKLTLNISEKNLFLLDVSERNSEHELQKLYDWQEGYDWVDWTEFKESWFYCDRCEGYNEGHCICYAR